MSGAAHDSLHAVLDSSVEMVFQPGFDFSTQSGQAGLNWRSARGNPLLQTIQPVIQSADAHRDSEEVVAQLLHLSIPIVPALKLRLRSRWMQVQRG